MFPRAFGIFRCFCFCAAAANAATARRTAGWSARCFILFQLFCESYMVVDVVQNPQKSDVYEYKKNTYVVLGVYSGIMYRCEVCITSSSGGFRFGGSDPVCCILTWCRPPVDRCATVWVCDVCLYE